MDEMSRAEAVAFLEAEAVAHVGTAVGGEPYVTPISFVVAGDEIVFRTVPGRRLDSMRTNPRVCIEVSRVDETGNWRSVLVWGDAYVIEDPNREADAVAALLAKYHESQGLLSVSGGRPFDPGPVVVAVPIETITGRTSGRGFSQRTRPGRL